MLTENNKTAQKNKVKYKTIWVSDIHLGTKGCQAESLLHFLKTHDCETLYLVGDIIDGWQLKSKMFWPQSHTNIIRRFLTLAKRDTKVIFITGNHDEFLRQHNGKKFGNIEIHNEYTHTTADGKKLLVVHGDEFDAVTRYHGWIAHLGSHAYNFLIWLNVWFNKLRAKFNYGYWSLSAFIKHKVKSAVSFISEYEYWVSETAKKRGFDGVVCGHIHHAEITELDGIIYHNCGDWVESCTALAEDNNGNIKIINWIEESANFVNVKSNNEKEGDIFNLINELSLDKIA